MKATRKSKRDAMRLYRLCLDQGLLNEDRARKVVQELVAARPRGFLGTLTHFHRLVQLDHARHTAKIESAVALPAELQIGVEKNLGRVYGPGLSSSFAAEPALIGGMRIRVGSDVYDGSVRGRLAALEQSF